MCVCLCVCVCVSLWHLIYQNHVPLNPILMVPLIYLVSITDTVPCLTCCPGTLSCLPEGTVQVTWNSCQGWGRTAWGLPANSMMSTAMWTTSQVRHKLFQIHVPWYHLHLAPPDLVTSRQKIWMSVYLNQFQLVQYQLAGRYGLQWTCKPSKALCFPGNRLITYLVILFFSWNTIIG